MLCCLGGSSERAPSRPSTHPASSSTLDPRDMWCYVWASGTTPAARRNLRDSSGCVQRCSSDCMWKLSLCCCIVGQCSRTCSTVPSAPLQREQLGVGARPIRCMYWGNEVWWPQRSRERWTRSSLGRVFSSGLTGGGWESKRELTRELTRDLAVSSRWMWALSEMPSGQGVRE